MFPSRLSRAAAPPALLLTVLLGAFAASAPPAPVAAQAPARARVGPDAAAVTMKPHAEGSVRFAIIGDTGTGGRQQYEVAERLAESHTVFPFEFVLMLGDNIYGRERPQDFVKKFELPYKTLHDLKIPFYASLGNHDDPNQRFYKLFNMNGQRYYTFEKGDVRFYALDSNYMDKAQQEWVKKELSAARNAWKIAFFHHPLYSSGQRHGSEADLRAVLEPLFLEYGVSVVFAGHEHFYERVKPQKGITYFTNGGGAKLRHGNLRDNSTMTAKGFDTDRSYMIAEIAGDTMYFQTISRTGVVVDSGTAPRVAPTPVVAPSDPAVR